MRDGKELEVAILSGDIAQFDLLRNRQGHFMKNLRMRWARNRSIFLQILRKVSEMGFREYQHKNIYGSMPDGIS